MVKLFARYCITRRWSRKQLLRLSQL